MVLIFSRHITTQSFTKAFSSQRTQKFNHLISSCLFALRGWGKTGRLTNMSLMLSCKHSSNEVTCWQRLMQRTKKKFELPLRYKVSSCLFALRGEAILGGSKHVTQVELQTLNLRLQTLQLGEIMKWCADNGFCNGILLIHKKRPSMTKLPFELLTQLTQRHIYVHLMLYGESASKYCTYNGLGGFFL